MARKKVVPVFIKTLAIGIKPDGKPIFRFRGAWRGREIDIIRANLGRGYALHQRDKVRKGNTNA